MEKLLVGLKGKKIDVNCGSNVVYRGEVVDSNDGILRLRNEDGEDVYVAIDKIAAVAECKDFSSRPGFIV
ncbi:MAG TPA: MM0924 family protein [Pyrinomonadaceae bacterium]|nr:MM0924 family protein [Pyrinomonadaceae bacterium]